MENVDSWDFTSSYPYVLVTHKYPSTEFKKCNITRAERMSSRFAYLLVVKFKNIKCKYLILLYLVVNVHLLKIQ